MINTFFLFVFLMICLVRFFGIFSVIMVMERILKDIYMYMKVYLIIKYKFMNYKFISMYKIRIVFIIKCWLKYDNIMLYS